MVTHERHGYRSPTLTTDIIIEHNDGVKEGIVLITRKNPPYGVAIPGGFAEYGISLEANARKEAEEETGLDVMIENGQTPLCVRSDPDRDPRGHMVSVTYVARGYGKLQAGDDAKTATLYTIDEVVDMVEKKNTIVFDHEEILRTYLSKRGHL